MIQHLDACLEGGKKSACSWLPREEIIIFFTNLEFACRITKHKIITKCKVDRQNRLELVKEAETPFAIGERRECFWFPSDRSSSDCRGVGNTSGSPVLSKEQQATSFLDNHQLHFPFVLAHSQPCSYLCQLLQQQHHACQHCSFVSVCLPRPWQTSSHEREGSEPAWMLPIVWLCLTGHSWVSQQRQGAELPTAAAALRGLMDEPWWLSAKFSKSSGRNHALAHNEGW